MRLAAIGRMWTPLLAVALGAFACGGAHATRTGESLDGWNMPADVRADYEVFVQRCSKCHSLARPLNSGIEEDVYWAEYVARMRRQPSSGISHEDEVVILRFLHYFSLEQKRLKAKDAPAAAPSSSPSSSSSSSFSSSAPAPAPAPARDGGA